MYVRKRAFLSVHIREPVAELLADWCVTSLGGLRMLGKAVSHPSHGRGDARDQPAISVAMNVSSQPAYLRLPLRLAFRLVSARARVSAILRSRARFRAAFRSRTRLASSRKVTSRTQWSPFSICQWFRMAAASISGGNLALVR